MTTIAGIPIPDSTIAREATEVVRDAASKLLFDHSRRVFLWASLRAERLALEYDPELLYVSAMFHDLGLAEGHRSEHERFEIDGANAAQDFLERHAVPAEHVAVAWDAIALHTTRGIPAYKQAEVRLVQLGVQYDVVGEGYDELSAQQRQAVLDAHPRIDFKRGIVQAFSAGFCHKPETTYGTINADILAATIPGYVRPDFVDRINRAPFES